MPKDEFDVTINKEQMEKTLKVTRNSNTTGPDNISVHHLKHLRPITLQYLAHLYTLALKSNIIPQI